MVDSIRIPRWKIWLLACRPKTLPAGIAPVIVGGAIAYGTGEFSPLPFVLALLGSTFIQIGANFSNDLFDFLKNADTHDRVGPLRVTQAGLVSAHEMKIATAIVFLLAFACGIYLVYEGGWPIAIIGLTAILFAVLYTGGPYPIGYHGLGDLFVLIYFGPVAVAGTAYVSSGIYSSTAAIAGLAPGLLSTAILTVNNLRDIDSDRKAGKKTLASRFGSRFAKFEYLVCLMISYMLAPAMCAAGIFPSGSLLTLAAVPLSIITTRKIFADSPPDVLNGALAETGLVLFLYSVLFTIGWLI